MNLFIKIFMMNALTIPAFKNSVGASPFFKERSISDTSCHEIDTNFVKGNVSVTGLIQSGNENRFVSSLLSELLIGNKHYEVLPITSMAYSSKPGAQVEGEYLENVIVRYHQRHIFYPAIGLSFEKSFLRKIDYRYSAGITIVANLVNKNCQTIKLGIGVNREFTQYISGAFIPPLNGEISYNRTINQVYIRLKGVNQLFKNSLKVSYDFFYQPNIQNVSDYRWTLIGNLDVPMKKRLSARISSVSSYENFVATKVSKANFRLTYGLNLSF